MLIVTDFGIKEAKQLHSFVYQSIKFSIVDFPEKSNFFKEGQKLYSEPIYNRRVVESSTGVLIPLNTAVKESYTALEDKVIAFIDHKLKKGIDLQSEIDKFEKINTLL